jgi:hypothetical protein
MEEFLFYNQGLLTLDHSKTEDILEKGQLLRSFESGKLFNLLGHFDTGRDNRQEANPSLDERIDCVDTRVFDGP